MTNATQSVQAGESVSRAKVFFAPAAEGETDAATATQAVALARRAEFEKLIRPGRPCAVKTHFGEGQNTGHIKPPVVAAVVRFIREAGGLPFVTDTNTLYSGRRSQAIEHLQQAADHGFTQETLGAPVIIADGLLGAEQVEVAIAGGKHFRKVRIAAALYHADSAMVLTHVKGHCQLGLGGAIKNLGMGCAARAGKLAQHHGGAPEFQARKCTGCGTCVKWCPTEAIALESRRRSGGSGEERKAVLTPAKCIGCGECLALCPAGAIGFSWSTGGAELIEKVCEHALGFVQGKGRRVGYLNFIQHLTRNCDCLGSRQKVERPDVGVLASADPVAADKASADLTRKAYGEDVWAQWWPDSQYQTQFSYGEKIGLGTSAYTLSPGE